MKINIIRKNKINMMIAIIIFRSQFFKKWEQSKTIKKLIYCSYFLYSIFSYSWYNFIKIIFYNFTKLFVFILSEIKNRIQI